MPSINPDAKNELPTIGQGKPVAVCGPIAEPGFPSAGGYESSNLRLTQLQASMGLDPVPLRYPAVKGRGLPVKSWLYFRSFLNIRQHILALPYGTIIHFTPLCRQFIKFEEQLIKGARAVGHPIVLDLRAGNKQSEYSARGPSYRSAFERILRMADVIAVEGQDYIPFVRTILSDAQLFHIPNFVMSAEVAPHVKDRPLDVLSLTYVGSVLEEKGLLQCVQLTNELSGRGLTVALNVIGPCLPDFATRLRQEAVGTATVNLLGPQRFSVIRETLARSHFFVFLTKWRGEGHSNALTEAMAQGVIPIVTDHGFCRSVVGEDGIVVEDRNQIGAIASSVMSLISQKDEMAQRAQRLTDRVRRLYTSDAVRKVLTEAYCCAIAMKKSCVVAST